MYHHPGVDATLDDCSASLPGGDGFVVVAAVVRTDPKNTLVVRQCHSNPFYCNHSYPVSAVVAVVRRQNLAVREVVDTVRGVVVVVAAAPKTSSKTIRARMCGSKPPSNSSAPKTPPISV